MSNQPLITLYDHQDWQLRSAELWDAEPICQYFCRNKAYLKPWEPEREAGFYQVNHWRQKLVKLAELHRLSLGFYFIIFHPLHDKVIGTLSFGQITRFPFHAGSLGYSLDPEFQGQGIMTTCVKKVCDYLFKQQNLHRIQAAHMPNNTASRAVLERSGFEYEGLAKDYLLIDGQWQDHCLLALTNAQWQSRTRTIYND